MAEKDYKLINLDDFKIDSYINDSIKSFSI